MISLITLRSASQEDIKALISECCMRELKTQLSRRSTKLLSLIKRGHVPESAEEVLSMSHLRESEVTMPDERFSAMEWCRDKDEKIVGTLNRKKFVKAMIWK